MSNNFNYTSGTPAFTYSTGTQPAGQNFNYNPSDLDSTLYSGPDFDSLMSDEDFGFGSESDMTGTIPYDPSQATNFGMQPYPSMSQPQEVLPMQFVAPAIPTPPANMLRNLARYHPEVGWYYPASLTPTSVPAAVSSGHQSGRKRKQCFGPADFFNDSASSQSEAPHDLHLEPAPKRVKFDSAKPSKLEKVGKVKKVKKVRKIKMPLKGRGRGECPSIEMPCVCASATQAKVPRPKNAFIIFRMQNRKAIGRGMHTTHNPTVSKAAGAQWRALGPAGQAPYKAMAEQEAENHAAKYPNYKYKPMRKGGIDQRFGDPTCTCGAFQANALKWKKERGDSPKFESSSESTSEAQSEPEELEEYVPPTSPPGHAPAAQMIAGPQPAVPAVMPEFGFTTPAQQAAAAAVYAQMQNNHALSLQTGPAQTPRRSTRNHGQISYATPYNEVNDLASEMSDDTEQRIAAAIQTVAASNNSDVFWALSPQQEGRFKSRPSQILIPYNSPPAYNTRSRSRVSIDLPDNDEIADFSDLFGKDGMYSDVNPDDFLDYDAGSIDAVSDLKSTYRRRSSGRRSSRPGSGKSAKRPSYLHSASGVRASPRRSRSRSPRKSP
ncbi:hypothetical protein B0A50_04750 [Salinomyces thailandicus]|uniref:HMG box domain-containing protein n=1 Tax=Salinomyces thailandicus TaxID=706561 RepID=A0A4U0TX80_9PEZI|nr:hypothetical protein B0A50_04750 [Salinomyces thailandica]